MIDSSCGEGTSIKLVVHSKNEAGPVTFTCDGKDVFDNDNLVNLIYMGLWIVIIS